jgi:hypothetical protein
MVVFKRHLPTDNSVVSLHVALNRAWDAIEAISKTAPSNTPSKTLLLGGSGSTSSAPSSGGSSVTDHNSLAGIQGGTPGSYYHLTASEYAGTGTGVFVRTSNPVITGPTFLTRTPVADVDYPVTVTNGLTIAYASLSAPRVITLPASSGSTGQIIQVVDESGSCSSVNTLTVSASGADTIDGTVSKIINYPYGSFTIENSGSGKWVSTANPNPNLSAGMQVQPSFTDLGTGSCTIGTGTYALYANATGTGRIRAYSIAGATFALTDGVTNYIVANYNSGSPAIQVITNVALINEITVIPVFTIYRQGTTLHVFEWDQLGDALTNKIHKSIVKTQRYRLESGLGLGEAATRLATVGSGTVWTGAVPTSLASFNSGSNTLQFAYHVAGVWTFSTVTTYNNTQYDDGTNLQTVNPNRYAVNFIYRSIGTDTECFVVLGGGNYQLGQAQASQPPGNLPSVITSHCILVGRIIVQQGASTATQIDSAFTTPFTPTASLDHNTLANLQGGTTGEYYHLTNARSNALQVLDVNKDPTGFIDPENNISTYDSSARTVTLTGTVAAYWRGALVPILTTGWVSAAHPSSPTGGWFLYYDGSNFVWSQTPWTFDLMQIAYVYYTASDKFAIRETHGLMPWQAHQELHQVVGTYWGSGGDMSGYVLNSTTAADRRPGVSATLIHDEDLLTTNPLLAAGTYTQMYLVGAGPTNTFTTAATDIVPLSGAQPYYNQFTGGSWQQTLMANNSYMTVWLVAVPAEAGAASQAYRYLWIQGQANNSTLSNEAALTFNGSSLGSMSTIFTEFIELGRVILKYQSSNWSIAQVDKIVGSRVSSTTSSSGALTSVSVTAPLTGTGTAVDPIVAPQFAGSTAGLVPTSAGGTTSFLRADGGWAAPGGATAPTDYISGLNINWVSGSSITIDKGACYIEGLGSSLTSSSVITISSISGSSNTWIHIYLYSSGGSAAAEYSTTGPAAPFSGTARSKTGDTSRRYLGSLFFSTVPALYQFGSAISGNSVAFNWVAQANTAPFRILAAGAATTPTTFSASTLICGDQCSHLWISVVLGLPNGCHINYGVGADLAASGSFQELSAETYGAMGAQFTGTTYSYYPVVPVKRKIGSTNLSYMIKVNIGSGGNIYVDTRGYSILR